MKNVAAKKNMYNIYWIMQLHENIFLIALKTSYILYVLVLFGVSSFAPKYLDILGEFLKYYVIFFLLLRFNPYSTHKFTEFDRELVFQSAGFLFTTSSLNAIVTNYFNISKSDIIF